MPVLSPVRRCTALRGAKWRIGYYPSDGAAIVEQKAPFGFNITGPAPDKIWPPGLQTKHPPTFRRPPRPLYPLIPPLPPPPGGLTVRKSQTVRSREKFREKERPKLTPKLDPIFWGDFFGGRGFRKKGGRFRKKYDGALWVPLFFYSCG